MRRPACEEMVRRPGEVPGWDDWGRIVPTPEGEQFVSLNYGLESHLSTPTALYHLAAAGLCQVQGQHLTGRLVPEDTPPPATVETSTEQPTVVEPAPDIDQAISPVSGGLLLAGVAVLAGVAWWSERRTKANDATPKPDYPDIFNQDKE